MPEHQFPLIEPLPGGGQLELHAVLGDDLTPAVRARISYNYKGPRTRERDLDLLRRLLKMGHTSPFEHQVMTFYVDRVPMYVGEQIIRHRMASYTKRSFRWTRAELPEDLNEEFHIPPELLGVVDWEPKPGFSKEELLREVEEHIRRSVELYRRLNQAGLRLEAARCVLPAGTRTSFWWTINTRSAINFLSLRLKPDAQWETRQVARAMARLMLRVFPETTKAILEYYNLWRYLDGDDNDSR